MKFMLPMTVLWICLLLRLLSLFSCHPFYYGPNILHAAIYKLRIIAAQSVEHFWRPVEPSNGRAVEQFWPTCTQGYYIHNNLQCRLIYLPSCCPHVLSVMCRFLLFLLLLSFQTLSIKPLNWTNFFDEPFFFLVLWIKPNCLPILPPLIDNTHPVVVDKCIMLIGVP